MTMKRILFLLWITVCSFTGKAQEQTLSFIPQPESVTIGTGFFELSEATKVYFPKKYALDLKPYVLDKMKADIGITLIAETGKVKPTSNCILFQLSKDESIKEEGYILDVSSSKITIEAKNYAGLFNGFQTLRQVLPLEKSSTINIPSFKVKDNPRFEWRGVMLDVSRHFQPKDFILKQIDVLSSYKINKFHWHLTDDQGWRIEIKKYPNLTDKGAWRAERSEEDPWWDREKATTEEPKAVGGFYTQEEIKEVIAYAKIRNVEIIPEIDVPGHSKALIASYPELFCSDSESNPNFEVAVGGKAPNNALCPAKEFTYEFLEGVIEEVADLFPSNYLHIGGDECNKTDWKKSPLCQQVMKDNNLKDEEELQSYFIQRVQKIVENQGKTMIGWDEILSGNGAPGATIMAWRRGKYTPQITAPQQGYPTIMTSYKYMYISQVQGPTIFEPVGPRVVLPLSKVYSHEPVSEELTAEQKALVLGNQASLWGEFTPTQEHCEYMLYPRALASAEVSWSLPETKNWERFQGALEDYHFAKLEQQEINVAQSLYSVYPSYAIDQLHGEAIVYLQTESVGYEIRYTLDGEVPTSSSMVYTKEFRAKPRSLLKAALFDEEGMQKGKTVELRLK